MGHHYASAYKHVKQQHAADTLHQKHSHQSVSTLQDASARKTCSVHAGHSAFNEVVTVLLRCGCTLPVMS